MIVTVAKFSPTSVETLMFAGQVNTGAVVSSTFMVWTIVVALLHSSVIV